MIRISVIVWLVVIALLGIGLFQIKYAVRDREAELKSLTRQIAANRDAIRVLRADWSYLNDPLRLADLARRHLDLAPAMAGQITSFDRLPPRLSAPNLAEPGLDRPELSGPLADAAPNASGDIGAALAAEGDATIDAILADMQKSQSADPAVTP